MRHFIYCGLLLLTACNTAPQATSSVKQVSVAGYGTITAYPNLAEITVETSFTKPKLRDAVAEVQQVVGQVTTIIKPFIRDAQDLRTSTVSTNKDYQYINNKEVFVGFQATQSLTIKLADLNRLEAFMEALLQTRISRIRQLAYSHSKADSLFREAKVIALHDALKSADKLCSTMGKKRGDVIEIKDLVESSEESNGWGRSFDMELYSKGMGGRSFKLTPELMCFKGAVQATAEIE